MKIKVLELVNMKPSLQKLIAQDLPIKTAFKISKIIKVLDPEYAIFEENKTKIFKKYGEEQIDRTIRIKPENMEVFTTEFNELLGIELEVNVEQIPVVELETIKLSVIDLNSLDLLLAK